MRPAAARTVAVLVLLSLLAVLWIGLLQPLLAWADRGEEIVGLRETAARYGRIAAQAPAYADALRQAESEAAADAYLTDSNDTLAAAALQGRLARLAEAARLELRSVQPLPAEDGPGGRRLAVTLGFDGPSDALIRFLKAVDDDRPLLFVRDMDIQTTALTDPPGQPPLSGRLTIAAYRRGGS